MKPRGLFDQNDPHVSFTQIALFAKCPARYDWEYRLGHRSTGIAAEFGRIGHAAIERLLAKLIDNKQGIGPQDLAAARRILSKFNDLDMFHRTCQFLERYGARANEERNSIVACEIEIEAILPLDAKRGIPLRGRIDRVDRGRIPGSLATTDYKLQGEIPSEEELKEDLQQGLYHWALRSKTLRARKVGEKKWISQPELIKLWRYNPLAPFEKTWTSVLHGDGGGLPIGPVKSEPRDSDEVEEYAREKVLAMMARERGESFNRHCWNCTRARKCGAFARETGPVGPALALMPKLLAFVNYRDRIAVMTQMKEVLGEGIRARIVEGGPEGKILEDGYLALLRHDPGGTIVPERTTKPHSVLNVDRAGRKA